jgi:hypothetical protein
VTVAIGDADGLHDRPPRDDSDLNGATTENKPAHPGAVVGSTEALLFDAQHRLPLFL